MSLPVNISLMNVDAFIDQHQCKQVTSLFIRESSSDEFHHDGLFSEEIFGEIGSSERLITFGYIDLRTTIILPLIYGYLLRIKGLYGEIMAGKTYAIFDTKERDFVAAGAEDPGAGTGYKFFIDRFNDIEFRRTESVSQNDKVTVIEKYRKSCLTDKFLVLPAGLRDMKSDEGKPSSDSINKLYASLMNYCQAMPMNSHAANSDVFDSVRFSIQKKANEIYEFLYDMIEGKFGYFQRKYASRNLALGTRNVITPADMSGESSDDPSYLKCDEIKVPVFQAAKMFQPLVVYQIRKITSDVIAQFADQVALINPDTLKLEYQAITDDEKNLFITSEGIEKLISLFRDKEFRFNPVYVTSEKGKKYYLYLVYDNGDAIYTFRDIEAFRKYYSPIGLFNPSRIHPLTYAELLYITTYVAVHDKYAYVTRYPAIEIGSTVPCKVHLGTTSPSRKVTYFEFSKTDTTGHLLPEYPVLGGAFVDSTILHPTILKGLGADFDGNCVVGSTTTKIRYTDEWLGALLKCDYSCSGQDILSVIRTIQKKTYHSSELDHYAEIRMDEFPQPGNYILDKHGSRVYTIPEGVYVESFNAAECTSVYSKIEHITVEECCEVAKVSLKTKEVCVSTNESVAVFDHETGLITRIAPSACSNNTYVPVYLKSDKPFGDSGSFGDGWMAVFQAEDAETLLHDDVYQMFNWVTGSEKYFCGVLSGIIENNYTRLQEHGTTDICIQHVSEDWEKVIIKLAYLLGIGAKSMPSFSKTGHFDIVLSGNDISRKKSVMDFISCKRSMFYKQLMVRLANSSDDNDVIPVTHAEKELLNGLFSTDDAIAFKDSLIFHRSSLMRYVDKLDTASSLYKRLLNTNVRWECVTKVEPSGKESVFDFDIPETKLYVVNNGVVTYDTVSVNGVLSVEATEEIKNHLNSRERFIHANSNLFAGKTDLIQLTIFNLSRDPAN